MDRTDSKNDLTYWQLWGIRLFGRGKTQVLNKIEEAVGVGKKNYWIATVNPEFVMKATEEKDFKEILEKTDLNVIDGVGLIWAKLVESKKLKVEKLLFGFKYGVEIMQGKHREGLVTGADLIEEICQMAEKKGFSVYFFGGWGDRAERTKSYFLKKYPKLKVVGARAEDFDFSVKPDVLFVARGMKKQEEWIEANLDKLKTGVVMGVGRSFDYYSGDLKRAPKWVQKMGMEWLYSLIKEPSRWKRQLALPRFVGKILFGGRERF